MPLLVFLGLVKIPIHVMHHPCHFVTLTHSALLA